MNEWKGKAREGWKRSDIEQGVMECDSPEKEHVPNDGTRQDMACRTAGAASNHSAVEGAWIEELVEWSQC